MDLGRLGKLIGARALSWAARLRILQLMLKRRLGLQSRFPVDFGPCRVFISPESTIHDYSALWEIWVEGVYRGDYRGATVIDVGAHKGYFGAFALLQGAKRVYSFEPEALNFEYASDAAGWLDLPLSEWTVEKAALGSRDGEAVLHIMDGSASHSLLPRADRGEVGQESVRLRSLAHVLRSLAPSAENQSLIVKIDIEGSECDLILGTPHEVWQLVECVYLEHHVFAPCSVQELVAHLARSGLKEVSRQRQNIRRFHRAGCCRSGQFESLPGKMAC